MRRRPNCAWVERRRGEGEGGNREVPPGEFLGEAEANFEEEGGPWGKHGFPHGSESQASDAPTSEIVDFLREQVAA
jgi:hypothetical protein